VDCRNHQTRAQVSDRLSKSKPKRKSAPLCCRGLYHPNRRIQTCICPKCRVAAAEAPIVSGEVGQQLSETQEKYRSYFQELLDELRETHKFTNARTGLPQNWYTFPSENSRVYTYSTSLARGGRVRVAVYIDCRGKVKNEQIFDCLYQKREEIDAAFGTPLSWERLDARRAAG
jgi:hypothetical protein